METPKARPSGCTGDAARCKNLYGTTLMAGFQGHPLNVAAIQEGHRMLDCALLKPGEICPVALALLGTAVPAPATA